MNNFFNFFLAAVARIRQSENLTEAEDMDLKAHAKTIEKILLPRLRKMGFVLIVFAAVSLTYGLFFFEEEADADDPEEEVIEATPSPNYYMITAIFIVVGAGLIAYVAKRRKNVD
jgi:hypothetical protein